MEITGEVTVAATPEAIWAVLTDPDELVECIPGAESITRETEDVFVGTITRTVAGYTLTLSGEVEVTARDPYQFLAATVSAGNTSAGSWTNVTANAEMEISESDRVSTVAYTVTAEVSGRLASLGSSLVEPKVRSDIEAYFEAVEQRAAAR